MKKETFQSRSSYAVIVLADPGDTCGPGAPLPLSVRTPMMVC
jgi:hypothetical protein